MIFGCCHGELPIHQKCDICLITGDNTTWTCHDIEFQIRWMNTVFQDWINEQRKHCSHIVYIDGNHDLYAETIHSNRVNIKGATHLLDSFIEIEGLTIFGTPTQPKFGNWAFGRTEQQLERLFTQVDKADIIISHSPPHKILDKVPRYNRDIISWEHAGNKPLRATIDRLSPKLVACSHLHSNHGQTKYKDTLVVNGSIMNEEYKPVNKPIVVEI